MPNNRFYVDQKRHDTKYQQQQPLMDFSITIVVYYCHIQIDSYSSTVEKRTYFFNKYFNYFNYLVGK